MICSRQCHYLRRSAGSASSAPTPRRDLHVTSSLASQLPPIAADEAALRPLTRQVALHEASKLTAPAADRRQPPEHRPRQHRIRRAAPSARAADAGWGWAAGCRTRPTRRPETQPLAQRGEPARRGGAERCRGTPLQRSAGRWRCLLHGNAAVKNGRSTLLRCDLIQERTRSGFAIFDLSSSDF